MTLIDDLPVGWMSFAIPGAPAMSDEYATYVMYPGDRRPEVPALARDWRWLRDGPVFEESTMVVGDVEPTTELSIEALTALVPDGLPADLVSFAAEPVLRSRLGSGTSCYFDLGDRLEEVPGGRLLHLISDQQWCLHWSVFLGDDGTSAVVAGDYPAGFELDDEDREVYGDLPVVRVRCADDVTEFFWRWWNDNLVARAHWHDEPLTARQREYVAGYGRPVALED
ncbi:MAG: hypothetical protein QM809_10975 [Gordonia sp. (in: high G+C Gram-positive bacteria)]|uniref:hypothetical protein n=1 Tax=Gordonia sp. (in: high G+C Gram-positive bacteria) TaxID=84139 RepID=UPI0039E2670F